MVSCHATLWATPYTATKRKTTLCQWHQRHLLINNLLSIFRHRFPILCRLKTVTNTVTQTHSGLPLPEKEIRDGLISGEWVNGICSPSKKIFRRKLTISGQTFSFVHFHNTQKKTTQKPFNDKIKCESWWPLCESLLHPALQTGRQT